MSEVPMNKYEVEMIQYGKNLAFEIFEATQVKLQQFQNVLNRFDDEELTSDQKGRQLMTAHMLLTTKLFAQCMKIYPVSKKDRETLRTCVLESTNMLLAYLDSQTEE